MFRDNFLYKMIKPNIKISVAAGVLKSIESIVDILLPLIMAKIIDEGIKKQNTEYLFYSGVIMISLIIIAYTSSIGCSYFSVKGAQNLGADLRETVFSKIQFFNFNQLNQFSQTSLIRRATKDIDQIILMYMMSTRVALRIVVTILGAIFMVLYIDFQLALIFLFFLPICIFLIYFYMKKSTILFINVQKKLDKISQIIKENLSGIRVVRALAKEEIEKNKFDAYSTEFTEEAIRAENIMTSKIPFLNLIMNIAIAGIIWFGGNKVSLGNLKIGEVIALINYLTMIIFLLTPLYFLFSIGSRAIVSYGRLKEIFQINCEECEENMNAQNSDNFDKNKNINSNIAIHNTPLIEFKNVSFSYSKKEPYILENINFKINKGETVSIIGGIGSGKTTLISLIPRFYEVTKGEILINNINVNNYNLFELRKKIGIVMQKSFLFTGTIEQNIKWGKREACDNEVAESLEIAMAQDFVETLPKKYKNIITKGGNNFSGGQKQRLSLARTVLKNSEILILDDSFSALDSVTADEVKKNINSRIKGVTKIIISQKIAQIKNSDKIIVLDNGKIVGEGSHETLIRNCLIYKEIYASQSIYLNTNLGDIYDQ
ncbi:MAG: ABC transporter ATP-binding protein [Fusobacteriaceae bacterium]|nr:ABC transporter ATP-binding protein [Fusobacteriaceae bacterium]MBP6322668.1 ABC transporter ATP-binding protein [Fusobacteriaceae bacterium]